MAIARGIVTGNSDPLLLGRVQIQVEGTNFGWASTVAPFTVAAFTPPPVGAIVWVTFEGDSYDRPVVLGRVIDEPLPLSTVTPAELAAQLGHDDGARPGRRIRVILRSLYPDHPKGRAWHLTPAMVDAVRQCL